MAYNSQVHHRRSIRLKGYDYSQAGAYFITLCTHNREHLFGEVVGGNMILNEYGKVASNEWFKTPEIRPHVALDVFVIMPNHLHGIIIINGRGESHSPNNADPSNTDNIGELHSPNNADPSNTDNIGELHLPGLDLPGNTNQSHSINKGECDSPLRSPSNTIGAMVRGYKSAVTKKINLLRPGGVIWQRNYYEHVIRNEQAYQTISEYIMNNPLKWQEDKFYSK